MVYHHKKYHKILYVGGKAAHAGKKARAFLCASVGEAAPTNSDKSDAMQSQREREGRKWVEQWRGRKATGTVGGQIRSRRGQDQWHKQVPYSIPLPGPD